MDRPSAKQQESETHDSRELQGHGETRENRETKDSFSLADLEVSRLGTKWQMKKQGVLVTPLRHHDASDGKAQVEKSHYSHKRAKEFLFSPDHFRLHTAIWK